MSRSRKKTPVTGFSTSDSEKDDKREAHQKERRKVKQALRTDPEALLPHRREVGNVWSMAKDGKRRFDPERDPGRMRK